MADERKIGPVEIDRLYDFLDGLQASGYTIDSRQYFVLSDLLMALIARGDSLDELPLKTLIAPLICSTPAEQQDFYQRFDRWYPTLLRVKQASLSGDGIAISSPTKQRRSLPTINRTAVIWVTLVVAVIALIGWLVSNSAATGTQVINSTVSLYGVIFAVFGFMVWLGWRASILYQENQYITRELANQEPVYTKVPVKAYIQDVMPVMKFKPIVSALRKRTQVPSAEVDVDSTIEIALNRNNWLEIVYRQRQLMPEYVVLIDRKNRLDQQARFVQEVLAKLSADGVWLHQYEFSGDPRICFPLDRKDTPLRLKDLQARHPDSRLLIFSGTNELINPLTGLLQDWLESLSYWQERAILTPDKLQKVLLEELQSRDFAVLPMTFDGLASLVRTFETDNAPLLTNNGAGLPAQLTERPMRWTGRDVLPEAEVKALVEEVKNYLGENGFYWLCATAVYPELRWELTLHLGSALKDDLGQPLLNPDILIQLTRLPWFRFGYAPDWIRGALVKGLISEQEACVRNVLSNLLSTAFNGDGFELRFASGQERFSPKHVRKFLKALFRNTQSEEVYSDHIFAKFILNNKKKKISAQLPDRLRKIIINPNQIRKIANYVKELFNFQRLLTGMEYGVAVVGGAIVIPFRKAALSIRNITTGKNSSKRNFLGGLRGKSVICPYCLTENRYSTELKQCLNCRHELPPQYTEHFQKTMPFFVQLIGWSSAGKTSYLQSLTLALLEMGRVWDKGYYCSPLTEETLNFVRNARQYETRGLLPEATALGLHNPYMIELGGMERWGSRTLVVRDIAGELFSSLEFPLEYMPYLLYAPVVFMVVSIFDLERERETIADLMNSYVNTLVRYKENHRNFRTKVVIILSKADRLTNELPKDLREYLLSDPFATDDKQKNFVDGNFMKNYMQQLFLNSEKIKAWISEKQQGGRLLINIAARENIDLYFTLVSAMGAAPNNENKILASVNPLRVMDPLFLALDFTTKQAL